MLAIILPLIWQTPLFLSNGTGLIHPKREGGSQVYNLVIFMKGHIWGHHTD